jgi:signal transduction histidine kinase
MDDGWKIEITDDGKGFDLAAVRERPDCYGLDNMAGRAKESGLGFEIISAPASGTRVVLMAHSGHFN